MWVVQPYLLKCGMNYVYMWAVGTTVPIEMWDELRSHTVMHSLAFVNVGRTEHMHVKI